MLSRFAISRKIVLIIATVAVGFVVMGAVALDALRGRMHADRDVTPVNLTQLAFSPMERSEADAQARALPRLADLRFAEDDHLVVLIGVHVMDVEAAYAATIRRFAMGGAAVLAVSAAFAWLIAWAVVAPIPRMHEEAAAAP